jgi:hypothetical protein
MGRYGNARVDAKRDGNEGEIIAALKAEGCAVHQINGKGVCDLLVCTPEKRTILIEVKMPGETLTPAQKEFHKVWPGEKHIVYTASQVADILKS